MDWGIIGAIVLQIVLIFLNAVFAMAEIAVVSTSEAKLNALEKEGNKKAKKVSKLKQNPSKFLATIQVAITLSGFLGSAFAAENFAEPLVEVLLKLNWGISASVLESICVVLITIIIAYFSIVFGELIPKRIAMSKKDGVALGLSGMLLFVSKIFAPLVWLLTFSTNIVLKIFKINSAKEEDVTEEEIKSMVESSSASGIILKDENDIIQNVFEMNDICISEICTHRVDVVFLKTTDTFTKWRQIIFNTRHSFYPVIQDKEDDVIGVLDVKDFFKNNVKSKKDVLTYLKKPVYVPESMKSNVLFNKMKESSNYFAIVVDEYGGLSGVISVRDLLEILVGDLYEEGEQEEILQLDNGTYQISGGASLDEINELFNLSLDTEEYDTFGGYVLAELGEVPNDNTTPLVETNELIIQVKKVTKRRIITTIVSKKESATIENP